MKLTDPLLVLYVMFCILLTASFFAHQVKDTYKTLSISQYLILSLIIIFSPILLIAFLAIYIGIELSIKFDNSL